MERAGRCASLLLLAALAACSREERSFRTTAAQTAPEGPDDPRIPFYQGNLYQVSQGGRYFSWYGCGGCHGEKAQGVLKLSDNAWKHGGNFDQVYRSIAGHAEGPRIPPEQLWQITAYVRDIHGHTAAKLRRQDLDQKGEPTGDSWSGPVR
ncbi:MAG TPA: hypothetical protein VFL92_10375 [Sphingomonas sp.]|nr:hypothetical protein [Sphingomonas sp.]